MTSTPASGIRLVPDMPICQQDLPLDWYQPEFQRYAEEYLVWTVAGKPEGCSPLLRCFGLSLTVGDHLAATIERLLGLAPVRPPRRKRR